MILEHVYKNQEIELNYFEIKNDLPPLVLIYAQGVDALNFEMVTTAIPLALDGGLR